MKRIFAFLLCLILLLGAVGVAPAVAQTGAALQADSATALGSQNAAPSAPYSPAASAELKSVYGDAATAPLLFYEDFSSANNIWSGEPISENRLSIENGYMQYTDTTDNTQIRKAVNAVNGVVRFASFDVMPQENDAYLGLLICYSSMHNYMLRLYVGDVNNSVNNAKVQLYKRADTTGDSYTLLKQSVLLHTLNIDTSFNQWITLSATLENGTIAVYADQQYLFTYTDPAPVLSGTVGVRCTKGNGRIDNIVVRGTALPAEEPDVSDTPTVYTDNFDDEAADTDPDYWIETYSNASIVSKEGYTESVLFTDDFSAASTLVSRGWALESTQTSGKMYTKANNLLLNASGSTNWLNYRVEADITIDESSTYNSSKSSVSGIIGRSTQGGQNGLEFALFVPTPNDTTGSVSPALRLYDRTNNKELAKVKFDYVPGTTYRLKMEMIDTVITCYVDNILYLTAIWTATPGTAGVHGNNFAAYYDNFKVTELKDYTVTTTYKDYFKTTTLPDGNVAYRGSADQFATTWLHVFEPNPVISADLYLSEVPTEGKAGVLGRYASLGGFVQGGYDFIEQKWYISTCEGVDFVPQTSYTDTALLSANTAYTLKLHISGITAKLYVNGTPVLECYVNQCGYVRVGLFVEDATACFDNVDVLIPSGAPVTPDVVSWTFYEDIYKHYLEVDVFGNEVLAFGNSSAMYSTDGGKTFVVGSGPYDVDARNYTSTIKVAEGKYLRILSGNMTAQVSEDQITWTTVATIVPANEIRNEYGLVVPLIHVSSMTKITLPNGKERIFLPIGFRRYNGGNSDPVGHITRVYYTDDGGYTWQQSKNDTTNIPGHDEPEDLSTMNPGTSFCEAKIVSCSDGTLRMYNTRNWATCMYYAESTDYGVTWSSWGTIPEMPCAISSFAVCEDPTAPGTWYMVYVKSIAYTPNTVTPRNHLVLCKTTDGKNWTEVMTLDRVTDTSFGSYNSIYQFVDPCLTVTEDYFYVGYARSNKAIPGSPHHDQRQQYLRIGRTDVHSHSYDNACDADCNTCSQVREVPDHVYEDDLDTDCNVCGGVREIAPAYMLGDLNQDNKVTDADAVHLLMHTFFPDTYPVAQDCDYNDDGKITDADATYLLMHTFFPGTYPIK